MGSRELMAFVLGAGLLVAAILLIWRVRYGVRQAVRKDQKNVRIDLMRRPDPQLEDELDGSR